jgi:hypothetical protein
MDVESKEGVTVYVPKGKVEAYKAILTPEKSSRLIPENWTIDEQSTPSGVAKILRTGTEYPSVGAAVAAADAGDTIIMLADVEGVDVTINKGTSEKPVDS